MKGSHLYFKGNVVFVLPKVGKKRTREIWTEEEKEGKNNAFYRFLKKIVNTSPCTYWPPKTKIKTE